MSDLSSGGMSFGRAVESLLLLLVRAGLGAIFVYAAWLKLRAPQLFAFSIQGYDIFPDDGSWNTVVRLLAYGIPWAELLAGALLFVGGWSRAGSLLLAIMLAGFEAGYLSVIARGLDVTCSCFGDKELLCTGTIGWCHVGRNAGLLLAALLLVWRGAGAFSLESFAAARAQTRRVRARRRLLAEQEREAEAHPS